MTNPVKLTSSCLRHLSRPFPMPYLILLHPLPTNPYNMSLRRMTDEECFNISFAKHPLILEVRRKIFKNRSMICASSIQKIWIILSTDQPYSIRTLSCTYRMYPQTSFLNKFLPNSWPSNVFLPFSAQNTPISLIFNFNVVVQFYMKNTP